MKFIREDSYNDGYTIFYHISKKDVSYRDIAYDLNTNRNIVTAILKNPYKEEYTNIKEDILEYIDLELKALDDEARRKYLKHFNQVLNYIYTCDLDAAEELFNRYSIEEFLNTDILIHYLGIELYLMAIQGKYDQDKYKHVKGKYSYFDGAILTVLYSVEAHYQTSLEKAIELLNTKECRGNMSHTIRNLVLGKLYYSSGNVSLALKYFNYTQDLDIISQTILSYRQTLYLISLYLLIDIPFTTYEELQYITNLTNIKHYGHVIDNYYLISETSKLKFLCLLKFKRYEEAKNYYYRNEDYLIKRDDTLRTLLMSYYRKCKDKELFELISELTNYEVIEDKKLSRIDISLNPSSAFLFNIINSTETK